MEHQKSSGAILMPDSNPDAADQALAELMDWVDDVADRFEAAWQALTPPALADFLGEADGARRHALLPELVKLDIAYRRRLGEKRQVEDYVGEFPEVGEVGESRVPSPSAAENVTGGRRAVRRAVPRSTAAARPADADALPRLRGYELVEELGHGGMGVVYKARQLSLNRLVALKMILPGVYSGSRQRARFRAEVEAAARLQHANIVQVYEVGEEDGRPFCALEYVDGSSLAQRLAGTPLPPPLAARLIETLARAVHYAHQNHIVHRDLKPANILMVGGAHTPLGECVPKITDFGLAKHLSGEGDSGAPAAPPDYQTRTGEILGTPSYMAPEQAEGKARDTGPVTDVYALGVILYELLTGRPPFKGESTLDTLEQVRTQEPVSPSRLQPRLPRDLGTLCLKCLHKDPRKRYASAGELADDLGRFLDGKPIHARPVSRLEKAWRWCRRNPVVAGLTASVALLLVAVAVAATLAAVQAEERAVAARLAAEQSSARELQEKRESLMRQIQLLRQGTRSAGWSSQAWDRVIEAARLGQDDRLQSQAAATLAGIDARLVKHFQDQAASSVAFDASGKRLLLGGTSNREGRPLHGAKLWDSRTDELVPSMQAGPGPVAFAADGTPLQLVAREGVGLLLWDVTRQQPVSECKFDLKEAEPPPAVPWKEPAMALTADGSLIAAAGPLAEGKGVLAVWEGKTGTRIFQHAIGAKALAFSPDKAFLAAADDHGRVTIWSVPHGKHVDTIKATRMTIHCLAFSPDSRLLAVGGGGGTLTVWDWRRQRPISECRGSYWDVFAVAFSPDGATLASGGRYSAKLWDVATGRLILELQPPDDFSTGLAFSADGRRLAISSKAGFAPPGKVVIYELHYGRGIHTLRGLNAPVAKLCFSPDGKLAAALSHNWQVAIWELGSGRLQRLLEVPKGSTADNAALAFHSDGRRFAFSTWTRAKLWDFNTGKEVSWELPEGLQDTLAFHPSGKLLLFRFETRDRKRFREVAADHPRVCRVRDLLGPEPTKPIAEIEMFNRHVFSIAAPRDGSYFVVGGLSGTDQSRHILGVFDGTTGKELWLVRYDQLAAHVSVAARLDPDGTVMAFPQQEGANHALVEMPSGRLLDSFPKKGFSALSPGGRYLGSVRSVAPGEAPLWSLFQRGKTEPLVNFIVGQQGAPEFSPDGHLMAWGDADGSVSVCDLAQVRQRLSEAGLGW